MRFLVLCLMAASACAQQLPLRYYTQQDGLGNLSIDALVQDRNGYMWVGTENGVFRYNGAEFRRYAQDEGLQGSYVSELLIDQKQRLWVATTEDLYLRAGKRLLPVLKGGRRLPINAGQHLVSSGRDTLLAVSEQHLFRLQEQAGVVTIAPYFSPDQMEHYAELATIHSVLDDGHGVIWAGCGNALCADDAAGVTVWGAAAGVPADSWLRIARGADGTLWARGEHRIIALPAGATRFVDRTPPGNVLSKGGVTGTLRFDPDGNLLSGTDRGLGVWRRDHWELFDHQNGLRVGGGICAALVDRDGGMWLATRGLGLIRWKGYGNWENWTSRQGLPDDVVLAFAHDGRHRLHIGTSAGLATWTAGGPPAIAASRDAPQQWSSLAFERDGTLWGATYTGTLLRQHGHGQMQMRAAGLPPVLRVVFDRAGRLWLATMAGVWMAPHPEQGDRPRRVDAVSAELAHAEVREVCEADNGALWFLTRHVLWRFHQQRWESYLWPDLQSHGLRRRRRTLAGKRRGRRMAGGMGGGRFQEKPRGVAGLTRQECVLAAAGPSRLAVDGERRRHRGLERRAVAPFQPPGWAGLGRSG